MLATDMSSSQFQFVPEKIAQQQPGLNAPLMPLAIDRNR
jgi:hypothetical protein